MPNAVEPMCRSSATNERPNSDEQILYPHRQSPNADTRCVVDRIGDCSGDPCQPDFTDTPRTELIDLLVRKIQKVNFDYRCIGVHRYEIVPKTAVDRCAVLGIVLRMLQKRHA